MAAFTMGANLVLKDMASATFGTVRRASDLFKTSITGATTASNGFANAGRKAASTTKTYASGMASAGAASGKFATVVQQSERAVSGLDGKLKSASSGLATLGTAMKAYLTIQTAKKGFDWLVGSNADMEQYKNTLTVVLGDATKATETLAWAQKEAANTPFEIPEIVEATTRLSAYGINAQKVLGTTGDMASVMGKPLMAAVEAVADAQTGEIERLKEFGITKQMLIDQAKSMGTNPVNSKGQITDQAAFNASLFALMEKRFKGGMQMQSQTFKGMLSNAADFMGTLGRQLGAPLFDKAKAGLAGLLTVLSNLQANGSVDKFVATLQGIAAPIGAVFSTVFKYLSDMRGFFSLTFNNLVTENGPKINGIVNMISSRFTEIKPVIEQAFRTLAYVIIPTVVKTLGDIVTKGIDVVNFFTTNWSTIKPFVEGITLALTGYYAAVKIIEVATIAWGIAQGVVNVIMTAYTVVATAVRTATTAWGAAQAVLNIILTANPIGVIIVLVGLLIGAIILAYNNIDKFKTMVHDAWVDIKNSFIQGVNGCIDQINSLIEKINGLHIPTIHMETIQSVRYDDSASIGSKFAERQGKPHKLGLDFVPYDDYLARLHKGEMVLTAAQASAYRDGTGTSDTSPVRISDVDVNPAGSKIASGSTKTIKIDKLVEKLEVHGTKDMDEATLADAVIDKLYDRLSAAADIAGTEDMGELL